DALVHSPLAPGTADTVSSAPILDKAVELIGHESCRRSRTGVDRRRSWRGDRTAHGAAARRLSPPARRPVAVLTPAGDGSAGWTLWTLARSHQGSSSRPLEHHGSGPGQQHEPAKLLTDVQGGSGNCTCESSGTVTGGYGTRRARERWLLDPTRGCR